MINVNHLSFAFTDRKVLKDLSFTVKQGDIYAILGPNGVGKTTLIKLLTGYLKADEGHIIINGKEDPYHFAVKDKRMLGMMMPLTGVYREMTGYEYLSFIGSLYGLNQDSLQKRIEALSSELQFTHELGRAIKKYSTGTQKKIAYSAAIIGHVKVLFLDEPFESVDPKVSYEMKQSIKHYVSEGGTVVITSHILETVQNLCNRYMIIDQGKILKTDEMHQDQNLEDIYMDVIDHE